MNIKLVARLKSVAKGTLPFDSVKSLCVSDFNVPYSLGFKEKETNKEVFSAKHFLELEPNMLTPTGEYFYTFSENAVKLMQNEVYISTSSKLYSTNVKYDLYIDPKTNAVCIRLFDLPADKIRLDISFIFC